MHTGAIALGAGVDADNTAMDSLSLCDQAFAALHATCKRWRPGARRCRFWSSKTCTGLTTVRSTCCSTCWPTAPELPLALVLTGRPALLTRRPDWGMPETLVQLAPLVAAQSNELAQALLQRMAAVPVQLTELYPPHPGSGGHAGTQQRTVNADLLALTQVAAQRSEIARGAAP